MQEKEFENILLVEGINAKGYGTIPKLVMKDRRLTAQAKAIYAYFCSYAGCGRCKRSLFKRRHILKRML